MKPSAKLSFVLFVKPAILLVSAVVIHIWGYFPAGVEGYYSTGIYKGISNTLRLLTHRIPFSIGDFIYILFIISMIVAIVRFIRQVMQQGWNRYLLVPVGLKILSRLLVIYIIFRLLWGLNYDRLGIEYQLGLSKKGYRTEEVIGLSNRLIDSLNACRQRMPDTLLPQPEVDSLFRRAAIAYARLSDTYPFLNYTNTSIKPSLFVPVADWIGFTGYYNPFTGEAQVRTDVPRLVIPFVACHEIGHQLGYASESEANFVGFLAALSANNDYYRYSAYNEMFSYAQREELFLLASEKDSVRFEQVINANRERMDTLVRKDRKEIRAFFQQRQNRISPAINGLYDQYLKINNQSSGMRSYDEVIGWLLAYIRKNGKI